MSAQRKGDLVHMTKATQVAELSDLICGEKVHINLGIAKLVEFALQTMAA
jgi:hypothetical protein